MRFADIFKRTPTENQTPSPGTAAPTPPVSPPAAPPAPVHPEQVGRSPSIEPALSLPKGSGRTADASKGQDERRVEESTTHLEVYAQTLETARHLKESIFNGTSLDFPEIQKAAGTLVRAVFQNEQQSIEAALLLESQDYLLRHTVNTAIFTAVLAHGARYTPERIEQVTLAALLHEVGIWKVFPLIDQSRRLSAGELKEVRKHPLWAEEILKEVPDLPRLILAVATQVHERLDGSGYPGGLRAGEISEESRLVGLACAFEGLTHPRAHRPGLTTLDAMKRLTGDLRGSYDPHFIKLLIEQVGFYPRGSWVELSTGERGRVAQCHPEFPLRPTVEILADLYGQAYPQPKRLDLKDQPTLYIIRTFGLERPAK